MKKLFAIIVFTVIFFGCSNNANNAKSGPFTFHNKTGEAVNVIITQGDEMKEERTFKIDETFSGVDYYLPEIRFVKALDPAENKEIIDNRYFAENNTADYFAFVFEKASVKAVVEIVDVDIIPDKEITIEKQEDGDTDKKVLVENLFFGEYNELLSEYSDYKGKLSELETTPPSDINCYTEKPEFEIFAWETNEAKGKKEKYYVTDLFEILVEKKPSSSGSIFKVSIVLLPS